MHELDYMPQLDDMITTITCTNETIRGKVINRTLSRRTFDVLWEDENSTVEVVSSIINGQLKHTPYHEIDSAILEEGNDLW